MISQEEAIKLAEKQHGPGFKLFKITPGVPSNFNLYGSFPQGADDVWCISCSSNPPHTGLFSSRAIVVHKETGKILYDGDAGDEG